MKIYQKTLDEDIPENINLNKQNELLDNLFKMKELRNTMHLISKKLLDLTVFVMNS